MTPDEATILEALEEAKAAAATARLGDGHPRNVFYVERFLLALRRRGMGIVKTAHLPPSPEIRPVFPADQVADWIDGLVSEIEEMPDPIDGAIADFTSSTLGMNESGYIDLDELTKIISEKRAELLKPADKVPA